MAKPYTWDNSDIEDQLNSGKSISQIAREKNVKRQIVWAWVENNFDKFINYKRKKKCESQ